MRPGFAAPPSGRTRRRRSSWHAVCCPRSCRAPRARRAARAPGQTLYVVRFTFRPGSEIFPHRHPGTTVLAVESGALGWTLLEGTAHVARGAATGGTATEDVTAPGTEVLLAPGAAIHYEDDVAHTAHTARNAGDGPLVLLPALVLEAGRDADGGDGGGSGRRCRRGRTGDANPRPSATRGYPLAAGPPSP